VAFVACYGEMISLAAFNMIYTKFAIGLLFRATLYIFEMKSRKSSDLFLSVAALG